MDGLLNSIKGLFRKKKDEELTPTLPNIPPIKLQGLSLPPVSAPSAQLAANPTFTPQAVKSNVGDLFNTIKNAVASVPVIPQKIVWPTGDTSMLPRTYNLGDVGNLAKTAAQETLRTIPEGALSLSQIVAPGFEPMDRNVNDNALTRAIYGQRPLRSFQEQLPDYTRFATKIGVSPKYAPLIGFGGLVVDKSLNAVPGVDDIITAPLKQGLKDIGIDIGKKAVEKVALNSADDVISAIAKEFKLAPIAADSLDEPIKLELPKVIETLSKKYNIAKESLEKIFADKAPIVGDGYVLQKQGTELVANIFDGFKNTLPTTKAEIKTGVNLADIAKKPAGVELGTKPNFKPIFNNADEFAQTLDKATSGGSRSVDSMFNTLETKGDQIFRDRVEEYKQMIRAGQPIDPIVVTPKGEVLDGGHRLTAMKELGIKNADVVVELPSKVSNLVPGGVTSKKEFAEIDKGLQKSLNEEYGLLTPKQLERKNQSIATSLEKGYQKNLKDETVNLAGKGDIQVPPEILKSVEGLKDRQGILGTLAFNRETPLRNIEAVAGKDAQIWKDFFFDRVSQDTQKATNFVNGIKNDIKTNIIDGLGIKPKSELDALVMRYGEKNMTLDELKAATPEWQKVVQADGYFRGLYDKLLTQINETIGKYGFDPVAKRQNYYTHFQEMGGLLDAIGNITRSESLPTWINGLTADFKPGKQFFKFAQPRLGTETVESAIGAVDRYLVPAANQIFRTDTIQRGRALERVLREAVQKNPDLPQSFAGNFTAWLGDYVNTLAGKKSLMARGTEGLFGRGFFGWIDLAKKQTSANMVAGNISSALTNFIPLTQAAATTEKMPFLKGLMDATLRPATDMANFAIDGIQSKFLTNRFPEGPLAPTLWQNVGNKLGWIFESVDKFVANTIVAGKYFEQKARGLAPEEAMKVADEFGNRVMADRSFGQMPQIFQNQGIVGLFTQFQLEINNQMSFLAKDIPALAGENKLKLASMLGQVAVYSWLFNNVYETLTGRRPAFDPIDAVAYTAQESQSTNQPSVKFANISKKIAEYIPFLQTAVGGGAVPLVSNLPKLNELQDNPVGSIVKTAVSYALPGGGGQLKKSAGGITDYMRGYAEDKSGRVKYMINKNFPNFVRAVLFGQYSFPEAQQFFANAGTSQSDKNTIILKNLQAQDPALAQEVYTKLIAQQDIQAEVNKINTGKSRLKLILGDPKASDSYKQQAVKVYQDSVLKIMESVKEKMIKLAPENADTINANIQKAQDILRKDSGKIVIPKLNKVTPNNLPGVSKGLQGLKITGTTPKMKGISMAPLSIKKVSAPKLSFKTSAPLKLPTSIALKPPKANLPRGIAFNVETPRKKKVLPSVA